MLSKEVDTVIETKLLHNLSRRGLLGTGECIVFPVAASGPLG